MENGKWIMENSETLNFPLSIIHFPLTLFQRENIVGNCRIDQNFLRLKIRIHR